MLTAASTWPIGQLIRPRGMSTAVSFFRAFDAVIVRFRRLPLAGAGTGPSRFVSHNNAATCLFMTHPLHASRIAWRSLLRVQSNS